MLSRWKLHPGAISIDWSIHPLDPTRDNSGAHFDALFTRDRVECLIVIGWNSGQFEELWERIPKECTWGALLTLEIRSVEKEESDDEESENQPSQNQPEVDIDDDMPSGSDRENEDQAEDGHDVEI
ncbi:hypothetical protein BDV98DRAFT_577173 [Pterulicium gracile]|uniref:Uncharacterized protein n=1 Tax=Pterulicium gracile TaxID=1884261 RepID=A0A5C3Q3N9_9AGAR|nr:hypothetical protein BDV98DRAFT_577173 [Pterula gracilis]